MSDELIFSSCPAAGEIAIGADDLVELDEGEVRRRRVEELAASGGGISVLMLVESLADPDWRVRRAAASALGGDSETDPSALLCGLLASEDAGERNAAIKALIKRGADSVPALLRELDSADPDVRNFACVALGQIGDRRATSALLRVAESDTDDNVRYMAIEALGRVRDERAIEPLIAHLDGDSWLAAVAAEALGRIGGVAALNALIAKLAEDPVGLVAAEALGGLEDARALLPLVRAASTCSPVLGVPALCAIGRITKAASEESAAVVGIIRPAAREYGTPELVASLTMALTERGDARECALRAAVWLGLPELAPSVCMAAETPEHAPLAVEFLADDLDAVRDHIAAASVNACPSVRAAAAMAIAAAGDERDLPIVTRLLEDQNQSVCIAAIKALARLGGPGEAPRLASLLSSGLDEVAFAAADALGALGASGFEGLGGRLATLAEEGGPVVRRAVARAFSAARLDSDDPDVARCLLTLARDPEPRVRAEVAAALSYAQTMDTVSALLVLSLDEDREVRLAAIRMLGRREESAARRALRGATADESRSIRAAAARGLTSMPVPEDIALVMSLLLDSDPGTVISALGGLTRSGLPGMAQAIVRLFDHESDDVREATLRALTVSDPETARELAAVVLSGAEPAWSVRLAAIEALIGCDGAGGARALIERALRDTEPMVAVAAVPGAFGPAAPEKLIELLRDPGLSEAARRALEAMGPVAAWPLAEAYQTLEGPSRRAAIRVLGTMNTPESCTSLKEIIARGDPEDRWNAAMAITTCGCWVGRDWESLNDGAMEETVSAILTAVSRGCGCVSGC